MPLSPGLRIGPYEIIGAIGAGGMGEVYRARDTRLGREVAIKILPEAFARDPERLARFEREARTLASLNHPNIAHVHGLEESGNLHAIVMELVDGPTLADLVTRAPAGVPVGDVLPIARQIADALEAAHEHGVIHRDLKPANIKIKDDGTVKVLDFGLAKALAPDSAAGDLTQSPTMTARGTQLGMILGTAAYMAPEQARGKSVDRRADIWSFGVVLTELLTGARVFTGDDVTEVLAKVIERDPDFSRLPSATPPSLRRLLARCLAKDPRQRLRDIGEARLAVDDAVRELSQPSSAPSVITTAPVAAVPRWRRALPWLLAGGLSIALVFAFARGRTMPSAPGAVMRLQITLPPGIELYSAVGAAISLAPGGSQLAFVGVRNGLRQVFLRRFDGSDLSPVKGSEGAVSCIFSPDGREVLVSSSDLSMRRIRVADGLVEVVTPKASEYSGGWLSNGRVAFTKDGRLWVSGDKPGAAPIQLTHVEPGSTVVESQPAPVPGRDTVLFVSGRPEAPDSAHIDAISLSANARKTIVERATNPLVTASGHLLFLRDNIIHAAPFDRDSLTLTGEPFPVLRDVTVVRSRGVAGILTVSDSGVLVYAPAASTGSEIVSVTRSGQERTLLRWDRPAANPRLSPDRRRLMFDEIGGGLWLYDLDRRSTTRLTDGSRLAAYAIFTRDGREAVFRSPTGIFRQPLEGSATPVLISGTEPSEFPSGLSPDGTEVFYTKISTGSAGDIRAISLAGGKPRVLMSTPAYEGGAQVSPDGKWMVYVSNELGEFEVFLQPYPALNRRIQVSSSGGVHAAWNPRGGEIFYRSTDKLMSVRMVTTAAGPVLSPPSVLLSGRYAFGGGFTTPNYTVSADGDTFILVKEQSGAILNIVLNWFEELKRTSAR